jgi:hypothetical protein
MAAGLLLLTWGAAWGVRSLRVPEARYRVDFSTVPLKAGRFEGLEMDVDKDTLAYLRPDAMASRLYRGPREAAVSLIYARDWREIHNPAGCFPAQGWQIVEDKAIAMNVGRGEGATLPIRRLYCTKEGLKLVALFVFAYPGGATTDWSKYAFNVALGPRGAGGLIIIANSVVENGDVEGATRDLTELVGTLYPEAVSFWGAKGRG